MDQFSSPGHSVTIEIDLPWEKVYDFLNEPLNLGKWALGCMQAKPAEEEGLYCGVSIFDNEVNYFKLKANREFRVIDFHIGSRTVLQPRISARVTPGSIYGNEDSFCLLSLQAWRDLEMSDVRWHQLQVCHETEMILVKKLLEREC